MARTVASRKVNLSPAQHKALWELAVKHYRAGKNVKPSISEEVRRAVDEYLARQRKK